MTEATEQDIQRALDLRSPHVNAIVAELLELRAMARTREFLADLEKAQHEACKVRACDGCADKQRSSF